MRYRRQRSATPNTAPDTTATPTTTMAAACRRISLGAVAAGLIVAGCGSDTEKVSGSPAPSVTQPVSAPATEPAPTTSVAPDRTAPDAAAAATPPPSAPSTSAVSTTEGTLTSTTAPVDCTRLTDFGADDGGGWVIVNDGVMGGRSNGQGSIDDSVLTFTGEVVTAGGGFTSVRLALDGTELDGSNSIVMRVRADDRVYGLTLADDAAAGRRRISHGADFSTDSSIDDDGWQLVEVAYDALDATVFGQRIDAEPFDPGEASEIGIIISDGVDGPFALDVDWIDACNAP